MRDGGSRGIAIPTRAPRTKSPPPSPRICETAKRSGSEGRDLAGIFDEMKMLRMRSLRATLLSSSLLLVAAQASIAEPVAVRHTEGLVHGFLTLRDLDGSLLADGDLFQVARGVRVTSRLVFHFKDGSLHDETAVFSQRGRFRLLTDHLVQKGPSFPRPIDMQIDALKGQVTVRYSDDHGDAKVESEHLDIPADVANGLIL